MSDWDLTIHTCMEDGTQPDSSLGDDWTIYYKGEAFLWEGAWDLSLGEVRTLFTIIKKCEVPKETGFWEGVFKKYRRIRVKYFPNKSDREFQQSLDDWLKEIEEEQDAFVQFEQNENGTIEEQEKEVDN